MIQRSFTAKQSGFIHNNENNISVKLDIKGLFVYGQAPKQQRFMGLLMRDTGPTNQDNTQIFTKNEISQ